MRHAWSRVARSLWSGWPGLVVRHLMTAPAITLTPEANLDEAARLMEHEKIHRVIVVATDGRVPVGVLSLTDLVRSLVEDDGD